MLAKLVSVICHPLFMAFGLTTMAYWIDKYSYYITEERATGAFLIMNFFLLVLIPAISIAVLSGLNLVSSISMPKREDRIIPLIITLSLYIWYHINVSGNPALPDTLRFVSLGLCLSVGCSFFMNNFTKISLHTVGISGLSLALAMLFFHTQKRTMDINLGILGEYTVSAIFVLLVCIFLCGIVGTSRLYLEAHNRQELYGGYLIGAISQIIAYRIIM